jgi:matrixin
MSIDDTNEKIIDLFMAVEGIDEVLARGKFLDYLRRFGYLHVPKEPPTLPLLAEGLERFERYLLPLKKGENILSYLQRAVEFSEAPRCGFQDLDHSTGLPLPHQKFDGDSSRPIVFRYRFDDAVPHERVVAVKRAMEIWEIFEDQDGRQIVKFLPAGDDPKFITIKWTPAICGDDNMTGAPIAHATYAGSSPGVIHFDQEETVWMTHGGATDFDVLTVAVHELGHNLGLAHIFEPVSPKPTMHPNFSEGRGEVKPSDVDVRALRDIYSQP